MGRIRKQSNWNCVKTDANGVKTIVEHNSAFTNFQSAQNNSLKNDFAF